jgi:hypothetical protein
MPKYLVGKIDLSQIECRLLNTVAGQWDVVEAFRENRDVYAEQATSVFGYPVHKDTHPMERLCGKVLELQAGYGSGEDKIRHTLKTNGVAIDPNISYRDGYRTKHPAVVKLWDTGSRFFWHLLDGSTVRFPGCPVVAHDHRLFHEPSGLWFDFTSLEQYVVQPDDNHAYWGKTGDTVWRHRVKSGWRKTYGAKLIENFIQWLASFPIRDAIVYARNELGLIAPLTVHDDVFVLTENSERGEARFNELVEFMSRSIPWLPECPIAVEAKLGSALDE